MHGGRRPAVRSPAPHDGLGRLAEQTSPGCPCAHVVKELCTGPDRADSGHGSTGRECRRPGPGDPQQHRRRPRGAHAESCAHPPPPQLRHREPPRHRDTETPRPKPAGDGRAAIGFPHKTERDVLNFCAGARQPWSWAVSASDPDAVLTEPECCRRTVGGGTNNIDAGARHNQCRRRAFPRPRPFPARPHPRHPG